MAPLNRIASAFMIAACVTSQAVAKAPEPMVEVRGPSLQDTYGCADDARVILKAKVGVTGAPMIEQEKLIWTSISKKSEGHLSAISSYNLGKPMHYIEMLNKNRPSKGDMDPRDRQKYFGSLCTKYFGPGVIPILFGNTPLAP